MVPSIVGDGYCNDEANNLQCGFDGGDCCYTCTSHIKCIDCKCLTGNTWGDKSDSLNKNGYCNDETNNEECNYDGGDCCVNVNIDHCSTCTCLYQWTCSTGVVPFIVGDGFCDDETNNDACNYDGGDCCINVNTDHCSTCTCFYQENCIIGFLPSIFGDGFCNDETNNADCKYDGGDCCLLDKKIDHCEECNCFFQATCAAGFLPSSVGDGICHDESNNADCKFDGGDCCLINKNTEHCMECNCFHTENCFLGVHPSVHDGICNDETNVPECDYDGYDCCNIPINSDLCSDCTCLGNLKIWYWRNTVGLARTYREILSKF